MTTRRGLRIPTIRSEIRNAIKVSGKGLSYQPDTGEIKIDSKFVASSVTTDSISEGQTNKFYNSILFDNDFSGKTNDIESISKNALSVSGNSDIVYDISSGIFNFEKLKTLKELSVEVGSSGAIYDEDEYTLDLSGLKIIDNLKVKVGSSGAIYDPNNYTLDLSGLKIIDNLNVEVGSSEITYDLNDYKLDFTNLKTLKDLTVKVGSSGAMYDPSDYILDLSGLNILNNLTVEVGSSGATYDPNNYALDLSTIKNTGAILSLIEESFGVPSPSGSVSQNNIIDMAFSDGDTYYVQGSKLIFKKDCLVYIGVYLMTTNTNDTIIRLKRTRKGEEKTLCSHFAASDSASVDGVHIVAWTDIKKDDELFLYNENGTLSFDSLNSAFPGSYLLVYDKQERELIPSNPRFYTTYQYNQRTVQDSEELQISRINGLKPDRVYYVTVNLNQVSVGGNLIINIFLRDADENMHAVYKGYIDDNNGTSGAVRCVLQGNDQTNHLYITCQPKDGILEFYNDPSPGKVSTCTVYIEDVTDDANFKHGDLDAKGDPENNISVWVYDL